MLILFSSLQIWVKSWGSKTSSETAPGTGKKMAGTGRIKKDRKKASRLWDLGTGILGFLAMKLCWTCGMVDCWRHWVYR